ncbi:hypothetical protein AN220_29180, partial [Streptomyces nanshensis]
RSVALPVRHEAVTAALRGTGADRWIELPPGRALTARLAGGGPDAVGPGERVVSVEEIGIAQAADFARGVTGDVNGFGDVTGEGAAPVC